LAVNRAMYYMATENSAVFKRDLKEASEAADRGQFQENSTPRVQL